MKTKIFTIIGFAVFTALLFCPEGISREDCEWCEGWFDVNGKFHVQGCFQPTEEAYYFWYKTAAYPYQVVHYWSYLLYMEGIVDCDSPCRKWVGSFYLNQHPSGEKIFDDWFITEGEHCDDPIACWDYFPD